jgi:ABC-type sugar transport system permease subunit
MATQHSRSAARIMMAPAVFLLLVWMLVPLSMTLWFSFGNTCPCAVATRALSGSKISSASSHRARSGPR